MWHSCFFFTNSSDDAETSAPGTRKAELTISMSKWDLEINSLRRGVAVRLPSCAKSMPAMRNNEIGVSPAPIVPSTGRNGTEICPQRSRLGIHDLGAGPAGWATRSGRLASVLPGGSPGQARTVIGDSNHAETGERPPRPMIMFRSARSFTSSTLRHKTRR